MNGAGDYRAWKTWTTDSFGRCGPADAVYFAAELDAAGVKRRVSLSVLEIGFGNGGFAAWTKQQGWRYAGTELDPELIARARGAGFDVYPAETPVAALAPAERFDLVVAFDVLEHLAIEQTEALLQAMRARLAPDGLVVARVPSGDSPFSRAIQHGDMTHRATIGSEMVVQLCIKTGLRPLQIRAPVFPVRGLGFKRGLRRAAVSAGRVLVRNFLRVVYYDNQPRVVEPNMVIVLARDDGEMR